MRAVVLALVAAWTVAGCVNDGASSQASGLTLLDSSIPPDPSDAATPPPLDARVLLDAGTDSPTCSRIPEPCPAGSSWSFDKCSCVAASRAPCSGSGPYTATKDFSTNPCCPGLNTFYFDFGPCCPQRAPYPSCWTPPASHYPASSARAGTASATPSRLWAAAALQTVRSPDTTRAGRASAVSKSSEESSPPERPHTATKVARCT